ncbi:hypothetical protein FA847_24090 [Escherichia coli]|nr:hypothetical protein [Escherichia coli]
MRALLTPEIAPRMGIVLFRPGSELMPLFMQGRVLLEPEPERYSSFASGAVPAASQPLADDPAVRAVFRNEAVIRRAGGVECLESWLLREKGCQWPHSDWHSENMTTMRHAPGAIRLCWHCDNQLRDQFTERLESMATDNCARWVLSVVRRDGDRSHAVVVTVSDRRYRLKGLQTGEVAVYDDQGQSVTLTREGIVVDGAGKTITFRNAPEARFEMDLEVTGQVKDLCDSGGTTMSAMRLAYNGHRHRENGQGSNTDKPDKAMEA